MWKHYIPYFFNILFVIRFANCCQCSSNHTDLNKEKRQLETEDYTATEFIDNSPGTDPKEANVEESTSIIQYQTTFSEIHETTTESYQSIVKIFEIEKNKNHTATPEESNIDNIFDMSENSSEVMDAILNESGSKYEIDLFPDNETTTEKVIERKRFEKLSERKNMGNISGHSETEKANKREQITKPEVEESAKVRERGETEDQTEQQPTVNESNDDLKKKCAHYQNGNSFKLKKMVDTWQAVYYRLPNKMKCFKINIRQVKEKEQQRYARVYGSFNDTVQWERCFLEIKSLEVESNSRRHFLQGGDDDKGVMDNIIIDEDYIDNTTYLTLHSEVGDQWLVVNNLLLMRDCDNGDYVVFTRNTKPRKADVMGALKKFGEKNPKGKIACNLEKYWLSNEEQNQDGDEGNNHVVRRREERHYNKNITVGVNYNYE